MGASPTRVFDELSKRSSKVLPLVLHVSRDQRSRPFEASLLRIPAKRQMLRAQSKLTYRKQTSCVRY